MLEELRTYLRNIGLPYEQEGECQRILGSESNLHAFANFFEQNAHLLHLVTAYKLHKFTSDPNKSFNKEELDYYKAGLADITVFFAQALAEQEVIEKLKQSKKAKQ